MLGRFYRFRLVNQLDATIGVNSANVYARRWTLGESGLLTDEASETTVFTNATSMSNGDSVTGSAIDNNTDKFYGGTFVLEINVTAGTSGYAYLYLEYCTDDAGTHWDTSDGGGAAIATVAMDGTGSGTVRRSFKL
jgi:hypothetical protein